MLDSLRNASRSWVAKLLLLLLVASFAVWGVSSSMLAPGGNTVLTVGDQNVSAEEYRIAYQREINALSQQFGMQLNVEQARALGIENRVISQLATGAALDQLAQDMQLGVSDARLAELIAQDPAFQGANGQFDRNLFSARLRNAGLREGDYVLERSKVARRSQIVEALSDDFSAPRTLLDALRAYRDESRDINYLVLSNAIIDPVKTPPDDVLSAWFENVKARYRAPEYRSFTYVKLEPADIADPAAIGEDELRAEYERIRASFTTPEVRRLEQIYFVDRAAADAAAERLAAGTASFDAIATEQGKTGADLLLGEFTRDSVPDPALAKPAFAVGASGGTTPVIDGAFGPVILRIAEIRPEVSRSFDEVKEELRQRLAVTAASQEILAVHDRMEDLRSNGTPLEEAARELSLQAVDVTLDSSGRDPDEEQVSGLPVAERLIAEVFATEPGMDAQAVAIGRDGYVWLDVREVTPERDRTLDEIRDKLGADWSAEEQRKALAERATALKARLDAGETLETIASELGLAVESKQGLKRGSEDAIFGPEAIAAGFSGPVGTVSSALGADGETRLLLSVAAVDTPSPETSGGQPDRLAETAGDDMLDQAVNGLKNRYGVSFNQAIASQITPY